MDSVCPVARIIVCGIHAICLCLLLVRRICECSLTFAVLSYDYLLLVLNVYASRQIATAYIHLSAIEGVYVIAVFRL